MLKVLLTLVPLALVVSAHSRSRVDSLPGWSGALPSAMWSGFVEVDPTDTGDTLFYLMAEAETNPSDAPLIWWMNGGPGYSSLAGLFVEMGPLLLNEESELVQNPFAWTKFANVLAVEFGPGVGFSYCTNSTKPNACRMEDPDPVASLAKRLMKSSRRRVSNRPRANLKADPTDCLVCHSTDTTSAENNAKFLDIWLSQLFPEFLGRPLYLAGESYAGVYLPTTAHALLNYFSDTTMMNLHGIFATDPCTDDESQKGRFDYGVDFAFEKGLIDTATFQSLTDTNPLTGCGGGLDNMGHITPRRNDTAGCREAWRTFYLATNGMGNAAADQPDVPGLPMYIDQEDAFGPDSATPLGTWLTSAAKALNASQSPAAQLGYKPFYDFGYTSLYPACNVGPSDPSLGSILDVWHRIVDSQNAGGSGKNLKRIVIATGDIDSSVGPVGTERAAKAMGYPQVPGGARRPWFYNDKGVSVSLLGSKPTEWGPALHARDSGAQVAGFTIDYNGLPTGFEGQGIPFTFFSVRNSGHMTPAYAPQKLYQAFFKLFLEGRRLAPLLDPEFADLSDDEWFTGSNGQPGKFAEWVTGAMQDISA